MSTKNNATPWSYSKLSLWEKCAKAYKYRYIDKVPSVSGPAAQRGIDVHAACENFVKGSIDEEQFKAELARLQCEVTPKIYEYIDSIRGLTKVMAGSTSEDNTCDTELKVRVNENFDPVADDVKDYYATFIFDLLIQHGNEIEVIDYKTGKVYEEAHEFQAGIYAYAVYCICGIIPRVTFIYLDQGTVENYVFTIQELEHVDSVITLYLKQIEETIEFNQCADQSNCRWCSYKKICRGG